MTKKSEFTEKQSEFSTSDPNSLPHIKIPKPTTKFTGKFVGKAYIVKHFHCFSYLFKNYSLPISDDCWIFPHVV